MLLTEKYNDFKFCVVNSIEPSEIPKEAVNKSQNVYYRENRWRKLPGLVEINAATLSANPVWGLYKHLSCNKYP